MAHGHERARALEKNQDGVRERESQWWLQHNQSNEGNAKAQGLETMLKGFQFDERAYLESLNLNEIKAKFMANLKRSVDTISKVE